MDHLSLQELPVWTRIGVEDDERAAEQRILVGVWLRLDTRDAAKNDRVSVDYDRVAERIKDVAKNPHKTIEAFAADIADDLLKSLKLKNVSVHVRKFLSNGSSASLVIDRPWQES